VLLVTVDTLRADRLGAYGHPRPTSPGIDGLFRQGTQYTEAIASACFTAPSMVSLSTALVPLEHGVLTWGNPGGDFHGMTAAERFREIGYRTAFVSGHGALASIVPLVRGFDLVVDEGELDAADLVRRAEAWVRRGSAPFFLWVHFFEPHAPYDPPPWRGEHLLGDEAGPIAGYLPRPAFRVAVERRLAEDPRSAWTLIPRLYDAEIATVDRQVSRLLERLEVIAGPLVVAFTADHGENLDDHAPHFDHRNALFDSLVRVPLLLRGPGVPTGERVDEPASFLSLIPTLLWLASPSDETPDLLPGIAAPADARAEPIFLDSGLQEDPHKGLRLGERKLTLRLEDGSYRLFDLASDPAERDPVLLPGEEGPGADLRARLERFLEQNRRADPLDRPHLTREERERLRALGYEVSEPARPRPPAPR